MVSGRLVKLFFKEGRSEEGFRMLDLSLNKEARNARGFQGYVSMFSCDQPNVVIILTIWEDDETFSNSKDMFYESMAHVAPLLEKDPNVEHCRIDTVNVIQ